MPASGVETIGRVGERDGDDEADAPGRDGEELGLDRCVAQALDDGGREKRE